MVRKLFEEPDEVVEPFSVRRPVVVFGLSTTAVVALVGGIVKFVLLAPAAVSAAPVTNEEIRTALAQHHTEMHSAIEREISILTNVERLMWINCVRSAKGYQQTEECGALHR